MFKRSEDHMTPAVAPAEVPMVPVADMEATLAAARAKYVQRTHTLLNWLQSMAEVVDASGSMLDELGEHEAGLDLCELSEQAKALVIKVGATLREVPRA